jgi:hypothetical protein
LRPLSIGASSMGASYSWSAINNDVNVDPQITVDYDISDWLALGVEAGYTQFGKLHSSAIPISNYDGTAYTQITYSNRIETESTPYVRASTHFTLNAAASYPIRLGLSGGYAFEGEAQPTAALSAGIARTISEDFTLDLDMVLSGVWSSAVAVNPIVAMQGITGIIYDNRETQPKFTSAFGLRAGIRYRP